MDDDRDQPDRPAQARPGGAAARIRALRRLRARTSPPAGPPPRPAAPGEQAPPEVPGPRPLPVHVPRPRSGS